MHAVEQAVAVQRGGAHAEQLLRRRRNEQYGAAFSVPGDDVGHVARQEVITVFFGIEQPDADAGELFGAKRQPDRVESTRR